MKFSDVFLYSIMNFDYRNCTKINGSRFVVLESSTYHHNGATWHKNVVFHVTVQLHNKYTLTKITSISNNQIIESFVPLRFYFCVTYSSRQDLHHSRARIVNCDISKKHFFSFFHSLKRKNFFVNKLFKNIFFFFKSEPMSHRSEHWYSHIFCYLINIIIDY